MPGPQSTKYGVSFTTIATEGPERSRSAFGVPVPSNTICVALSADLIENNASPGFDGTDNTPSVIDINKGRPIFLPRAVILFFLTQLQKNHPFHFDVDRFAQNSRWLSSFSAH